MNFPDLDHEVNTDPRRQIAEVERKNREESANTYFARELVARVVANHRERVRSNMAVGLRNAGPRKPRSHETRKRKPYMKRGTPVPTPVKAPHWAQSLLDYVRRDDELATDRKSV